MAFTTIKKLLMSAIVVGILASFTVGGTFAIFNGKTKNAGSIASGSLLMANSVGGGSSLLTSPQLTLPSMTWPFSRTPRATMR